MRRIQKQNGELSNVSIIADVLSEGSSLERCEGLSVFKTVEFDFILYSDPLAPR